MPKKFFNCLKNNRIFFSFNLLPFRCLNRVTIIKFSWNCYSSHLPIFYSLLKVIHIKQAKQTKQNKQIFQNIKKIIVFFLNGRMETRERPNILITGTPGTGKSALCKEIVKQVKITYFSLIFFSQICSLFNFLLSFNS